MNNPTYMPKIKRLYINALRVYEHKHFSVMSVAFFVLVWLTLGNAISVLYSLGITVFTEKYNFTFLLIYIFSVSLESCTKQRTGYRCLRESCLTIDCSMISIHFDRIQPSKACQNWLLSLLVSKSF